MGMIRCVYRVPGLAGKTHGRDGMVRLRLRRWARLGGISAVLLVALTVAVVQAASNTDYAYDEHNGCEFHGEGHYNTSTQLTYARTNSLFGCATKHAASNWTWNGSAYVESSDGIRVKRRLCAEYHLLDHADVRVPLDPGSCEQLQQYH